MAGSRSGVILLGRRTGSAVPVTAKAHLAPVGKNQRTAGRVGEGVSVVTERHPAPPETTVVRREATVASRRGTDAVGPAAADAMTTVGRSGPTVVSAPIGADRNVPGRPENAAAGPADPMIALVSGPMIRGPGDSVRLRIPDAVRHEDPATVAPGPVGRNRIAAIVSAMISGGLRTVRAPIPPVAVTGGGATSAGAAADGKVPMIAGSDRVAGPNARTAEPAEVTRRAARRVLSAMPGRAVRAVGAVRALPGEQTGGRRVPTSPICPTTFRPAISIRRSGAIC